MSVRMKFDEPLDEEPPPPPPPQPATSAHEASRSADAGCRNPDFVMTSLQTCRGRMRTRPPVRGRAHWSNNETTLADSGAWSTCVDRLSIGRGLATDPVLLAAGRMVAAFPGDGHGSTTSPGGC